jgi:hypothetical protein
MRGCLSVIGLVVAAFVIIVIVAAVSTSYSSAPSNTGNLDFNPPPKSTKHGWVTVAAMGDKLDFWHAPDDECNAMELAAREIVAAQQEGRDADLSVAEDAPGRQDIDSGVRVQILGHASDTCHGTTTDFTRVRVVDTDSDRNGQAGYLVEGRLSRQ